MSDVSVIEYEFLLQKRRIFRMKTVIVTASVHHGNTRKVVDAIAKEFEVQ